MRDNCTLHDPPSDATGKLLSHKDIATFTAGNTTATTMTGAGNTSATLGLGT